MIRFILVLSVFLNISAHSQICAIAGIVVDKKLNPVPGISIFAFDSFKVGETDAQGKFQVDNTFRVKSLVFRGIGMETVQLNLNDSCLRLELVMLNRSTYDFISLEEVDGLRRKEFNKLPKLRKKAVENGIFVIGKACYKQVFLPDNIPQVEEAN